MLEVDWKVDYGLNTTFVGPGHGSLVETPNGDTWYAYHTWRYNMINVYPPGRVLNLDKVEWTNDGWPVIGNPTFFKTPGPITSQNECGGP